MVRLVKCEVRASTAEEKVIVAFVSIFSHLDGNLIRANDTTAVAVEFSVHNHVCRECVQPV